MIYLLLAVLSSAGVSLVMRLSLRSVKNNISMLAMGYLSCTILAVIHTMLGRGDINGPGIGMAAILGMIAGVLLLAGFITLQMNVRINGVVLSGIFSKLGVLVPIVVSMVFFGERPELTQAAGFVLAVAAIILINSEKDGGKAGSKMALIILLLANGSAEVMSKIYDEAGRADMREFYLLSSFLVAFLLSMIIVFVRKEKITGAEVGYGLLLGIPNFYSIRFVVMALAEIPAVITFPTYSVATIVVVSMIGVLVFGEKLGKRQKAAIGIILAALVLLNI